MSDCQVTHLVQLSCQAGGQRGVEPRPQRARVRHIVHRRLHRLTHCACTASNHKKISNTLILQQYDGAALPQLQGTWGIALYVLGFHVAGSAVWKIPSTISLLQQLWEQVRLIVRAICCLIQLWWSDGNVGEVWCTDHCLGLSNICTRQGSNYIF